MRAGEGKAVSFLALPVRCREGGRFQQAVLWPKTLQVDTRCQTATMTSMHAVDTPQRLSIRGSRRLGDSVPDRIEDADLREAAR